MPHPSRHKFLHALIALALLGALIAGGAVSAQARGTAYGGAAFVPPPPPPKKAKIMPGGKVRAPRGAPRRVKRVIKAANRLVNKPYRYGGGHKPFRPGVRGLDSGYDCSGAASYALYGGRFLRSPMPSGSFVDWGRRGPGRWITVYAHRGHAYVGIAGLRLDTGYRDRRAAEYGTAPGRGPRWNRSMRPFDSRYVLRHPRGL